jgi:hypothetical protein
MTTVSRDLLVTLTIGAAVLVFALSMLLPLGLRALKMRWARDATALLVFLIVMRQLGHPGIELVAALALMIGSIWFGVRSWQQAEKIKKLWIERWHNEPAMTVELPLHGRWKATGCGPQAAKNHHLAVRDQWFAIDFVREDGVSLGSEILAPVDGTIAYVEDGHTDVPPARWTRKPNRRSPAGNYVAIEVTNGAAALSASPGTTVAKTLTQNDSTSGAVYLVLGHLQQGSICVEIGTKVRVGDVVGHCGNSGNPSKPHLHMHLQDGPRIAVGANGIPLRMTRQPQSEWLEPSTILES